MKAVLRILTAGLVFAALAAVAVPGGRAAQPAAEETPVPCPDARDEDKCEPEGVNLVAALLARLNVNAVTLFLPPSFPKPQPPVIPPPEPAPLPPPIPTPTPPPVIEPPVDTNPPPPNDIPEPASLILGAIGFGAAGLYAAYRRKGR